MPELPEVETTVRQIHAKTRGLLICDVWTDYGSPFNHGKPNIKYAPFFKKFKKAVVGRKIKSSSRRGKHVLIHLSDEVTILVHMKMSGHFLYGKFKKTKSGWTPDEKRIELHDPYNRFIHLVFVLSNGKHLAFSDLRKFAKVTFFHDKEWDSVTDLSVIGPEPLEKDFIFSVFKERLLLKPRSKIKPALMDQTVIAGIGNIYSDEILFEAGVHPEERVWRIPLLKLKKMYEEMQRILTVSISVGGDSESDFRDLDGKRGEFQNHHKAYRHTGEVCSKKGCRGTIVRKVVAGRSAHFCNHHQTLLKSQRAVS